MPPKKMDPETRFWEKVDIRSEGECWPWKASYKGPGYGVFYDGERLVGANRFALALKLGRPLLPQERSRHTCDWPPCCNPNHLIVGTQKDNMRDKSERGRHHSQKKTRCPNNHPYDSVHHRKDGRRVRVCLTCKRESYHRKKREAAA